MAIREIMRLLMQPATARPEIVEVRERLVNILLGMFAVAGNVPVGLGAVRAVRAGDPGFALVYCSVFALLVLGAVFARRLPFQLKAWILVGVGMTIGVASLFRVGLSGVAIEVMTTFTVLCAVLLGPRRGVQVLLVGLAAIVAASIVTVTGTLDLTRRGVSAISAPSAWVVVGAVFTLVASMLVMSQQLLLDSLQRALDAEQKRREELIESEKRFRELAELLPETVFETDRDGRLTFVNQAAYRVFGYEPEQGARGLTALDVIAPEDHARAREGIAQVLAGGASGARDYMARRRDGSRVPVLVTSSRILRGEEVVGLRGVIIDVSEKKRLEEQLHQVQKMEALGKLAGGVAHDFNNVLMGIQGEISLVLGPTPAVTEDTERLHRVEEYVASAAGLTRQLLALGRGGAYEVKPTDLGDLVQRSVNVFARTHKQLELSVEPSIGLWTTEVDRGQIEQLLLNLLLNAAQALGDSGRVAVRTANTALDETAAHALDVRPGPYVCLTVSDDGPGIAPEVKPRIFEPFFSTKEPGHGTGLGLASVFGIARGHGGGIEVESEPGAGATFRVYLPAHPDRQAVGEAPRQAGRLPTGTETVLVVDDERMVLQVAAPLLQRLGYKVHVASSGQEALETLQRLGGEVSLVLLDMIMPGMNGVQAFTRMREIAPRVKILLSSGYSDDGEARQVMAAGGDGFIGKPYRLEQLASKVRAVLDAKRA